jgi:hypothetical protein
MNNEVKLEVANPVAESVIPKLKHATRSADLSGARVGLYWNFKPGGNVGLDQVAVRLGELFPAATFTRFQGAVGASVRHVTPKQADEIAAQCDVVVGTTGD